MVEVQLLFSPFHCSTSVEIWEGLVAWVGMEIIHWRRNINDLRMDGMLTFSWLCGEEHGHALQGMCHVE